MISNSLHTVGEIIPVKSGPRAAPAKEQRKRKLFERSSRFVKNQCNTKQFNEKLFLKFTVFNFETC